LNWRAGLIVSVSCANVGLCDEGSIRMNTQPEREHPSLEKGLIWFLSVLLFIQSVVFIAFVIFEIVSPIIKGFQIGAGGLP
jgi:hypothetical protein